MKHALHIVCFDIPFPPTYGGAIDVFYRIQALAKAGVDITLHCTYKGTLTHYTELESLCKKVYYYPRDMRLISALSSLPFAVNSRRNKELLQHLLEDNNPILFEGLVDGYYLNHPALKNRQRFFRECNVEHDYYHALGRATTNLWKKIYYHIEAERLKRFEPVIQSAKGIFALAHQDEDYFRQTYPNTPVYYVPCFHENEQVTSLVGKGDYILYHGNLSVAENDYAAQYIVQQIAPRMPHIRILIAGKKASPLLREQCRQAANVQLIENPSHEQMHQLIAHAHIHLMLTFQATGIKLKLINVLYQGRFVVANEVMVTGTPLASACWIANTPEQIADQCQTLMQREFTAEQIQERKKILTPWDVHQLGQQLLSLLFA